MSLAGVLGTAAILCVCSAIVGEAVWRVTGVERRVWLGPPVGLATLMVIEVAAVRLPGHGKTGAAVLVGVTLVALAIARQRLRGEVPRALAVAMALGLLAGLAPFAASGRVGLLGVTDNSDLYGHLMLADGIRTGHHAVGVDTFWLATYPTGPHSLVASLATLLGTDVGTCFIGLIVALAALSVATALAALHELPPVRRQVGALVAGLPYLVAAYLIQASFKEPLLALLVVAWALALPVVAAESRGHPLAALPLVALGAAAFASYSAAAIVWPGAVTALWAAAAFARNPRVSRSGLRAGLRPALVFVALFAVAAAPQAVRAKKLLGAIAATASGQSSGGNIRAEVPSYEVFGVWPSRDLRVFGASEPLLRMLAVLAGCAVLYAAWRCWRRGRLELLAAATGTLVLYGATRARATPYYSAKALAIASFPVLLLAVYELLAALPSRPRASKVRPLLATGAAVVFIGLAGWSTLLALRAARVAPADHNEELAALRGLVRGQPTLYMGQNDYIGWLLRGTPVAFPYAYVGVSQVQFQTRPTKPFEITRNYDFDSVAPGFLDSFRFAIAPRSAYLSAVPPNWRLVRQSRSYDVWERFGPTPPRDVLGGESNAPGAPLDCTSPLGRQLADGGGTAGVRPRPLALPTSALTDRRGRALPVGEFKFSQIAPDGTAYARMTVPRGRYELAVQYVSPVELRARVAGTRLSAPPSMEGPGGYWRFGDLAAPGGPLTIEIHADDNGLLEAFDIVLLGQVALTPLDSHEHPVPLRSACGRYVDWYRTA